MGRFSAKGIDVHARPGDDIRSCLDCRSGPDPFGLPQRAEWDKFAASMLKHYDIELPDGDRLIEAWAA